MYMYKQIYYVYILNTYPWSLFFLYIVYNKDDMLLLKVSLNHLKDIGGTENTNSKSPSTLTISGKNISR